MTPAFAPRRKRSQPWPRHEADQKRIEWFTTKQLVERANACRSIKAKAPDPPAQRFWGSVCKSSAKRSQCCRTVQSSISRATSRLTKQRSMRRGSMPCLPAPSSASQTARSRRLGALMQLSAPHQAQGDVGRLQRCALGRRMRGEIAGDFDEDASALVGVAPDSELPDSRLSPSAHRGCPRS